MNRRQYGCYIYPQPVEEGRPLDEICRTVSVLHLYSSDTCIWTWFLTMLGGGGGAVNTVSAESSWGTVSASHSSLSLSHDAPGHQPPGPLQPLRWQILPVKGQVCFYLSRVLLISEQCVCVCVLCVM